MVNVADFSGLDFEETHTENRDVDLPFLEAIQGYEEPFSYPKNFYDTLEELHPKAAFVPSPEQSVFEQPLDHTMWTSNFWETPHKSFPE